MKKTIKKYYILLLLAVSIISCDKMLDVDSERVVFDDQYNMTATNDSLFSMFGVFTQLQKIADSYVLLGELRGELMDVRDESNLYLKEINNFEVSPENPYASNVKDFYSIVNNCNYIIKNIPNAQIVNEAKIVAAAKAVRAWTYMQIALNYGDAYYYTEPILSVNEAEQVQAGTPMKFNNLAAILISELLPLKDVEFPRLQVVFSHNFNNSFFPVRYILGDLYLWTGQYEKAAQEYKDLIYLNNYTISNNRYRTLREASNQAFTGGIIFQSGGWHSLFGTGSTEYITNIGTTNQYGHKFHLDSMVWRAEVVSSKVAVENWNKQNYVESASLDTLGDLRRIGSVSSRIATSSSANNDGYLVLYDSLRTNYLAKYLIMNPITENQRTNKRIIIYRVAQLYLRYAEAINRAGKPNMAFAVMKNGLNALTMANKKIIPLHEVDTVNIPNYLDFGDQRFDNNIGTKMRGAGRLNVDTTHYIIPNLPTLQDSILWVEDKIVEELALETAFEGNRFQDLMRVALRRNDNAYLADKVASKHTVNKDAIRSKLMNQENWYIKK